MAANCMIKKREEEEKKKEGSSSVSKKDGRAVSCVQESLKACKEHPIDLDEDRESLHHQPLRTSLRRIMVQKLQLGQICWVAVPIARQKEPPRAQKTIQSSFPLLHLRCCSSQCDKSGNCSLELHHGSLVLSLTDCSARGKM